MIASKYHCAMCERWFNSEPLIAWVEVKSSHEFVKGIVCPLCGPLALKKLPPITLANL